MTVPDDKIPVIDDRRDNEPAGPRELPDELVDELLASARTPGEITGPDGLLAQRTKRLVERAMDAELTEHLRARRSGRARRARSSRVRRSLARALRGDLYLA